MSVQIATLDIASFTPWIREVRVLPKSSCGRHEGTLAKLVAVVALASHVGDINRFQHEASDTFKMLHDLKGWLGGGWVSLRPTVLEV